MAIFFNCSYARAAVKSYTAELMPKSHFLSLDAKNQRREKFRALFDFTAKEVTANPQLASFAAATETSTFDRHCARLLEAYNRTWKVGAITRTEWLDHFQPANWTTLTQLQQLSHNLHDCYACAQQCPTFHSAFPVKSRKAPTNTMAFSTTTLAKRIEQSKEGNKENASKAAAQSCLELVQKEYQAAFGGDIRTEWEKQSSTGLQLTPTSNERRQAWRAIDKQNKKDREKEMEETDFNQFYGTASSQTSYENHRLDTLLGSKEKAEERMRDRLNNKREKIHVSLDLNKIKWNWRALVKEAKSWNDGQIVNWQAVARRYEVHRSSDTAMLAGNGGQIIQAVLIDAGVDVTQFLTGKGQKTGEPRCRRSVKRTRSGIQVPSHTKLSTLQKKKEQLYQDGVLTKAINIVPREYSQVKLTECSTKVQTCTKTIYGQKVPLHELVRTIIRKFEEKGYLAARHYDPDKMTGDKVDERLRQLGIATTGISEEARKQLLRTVQTSLRLVNWGDHSALSGHGYLLYTVTPMFDEAVFTNPKLSAAQMQREVEKPHIYLLAMSSDTLADKLMYVDERLTDIKALKVPIKVNGLELSVSLRGFKGDNPEQEFEAGVNQGGHYKCSACGLKTGAYVDIAASLLTERLSIDDRQMIATAGVFGRQPSHAKPFHNLKKEQLQRELTVRGLDSTGLCPELKQRLQAELQGTQRSLTLLFRHPTDTKEEHNLGEYEIFASEGLHDVKDHVKNVMEELPYHLPDEAKKVFDKFYDIELRGRAMVRGSDYRRAAIKLPAVLKGKVRSNVQGLVDSLAELTTLAYIMENERTPRAILRLYNTAYCHAHYCTAVLFPPKHLSVGVLCGLYFHKLTVHAPEDTRIVSGYTRLAECDERQFKELRALTHNTTGRPADVARQLCDRLQLKQMIRSSNQSFAKEDKTLKAKASKLPSLKEDTIFTKDFVNGNKTSFQAHLERIADFLLPGPGIWWRWEGDSVRFLDGGSNIEQHPEGPCKGHFRSSQVKDELHRVKSCWQRCLDNNIDVPLRELRLQQNGARARYVTWPLLPTEPVTKEATIECTVHSEEIGAHNEDTSQHEEENGAAEQEQSGEDNLQETNDMMKQGEDGDKDCARQDQNQRDWTGQEEKEDWVKQMEQDQENCTTEGARQTSSFHNQLPKNVPARRLPFTAQADGTDNTTDSTQQENDVVVQPADENDCPARPDYQSFHGKWAAVALGDTPDVREYDKLRTAIKKGDTEKTAQFKILRDNLYDQLVRLMRDLQSAEMKGNITKQTQQKRKVVERVLLRWHC